MTRCLQSQRTPIRVITQLTDHIGNLLTAWHKTANTVQSIRLMITTVFDRQRGAEASAELGGVGDQVHGVGFSVVRRPDGVAVFVIVEAEERMGVTSGQATELD